MSTHGPQARGLYDPRFEHDACGVNFVCHLRGEASHEIVDLGIGALCNMAHRGALGAEMNTGDGAGILIQVPDAFYRDVVDFELPDAGEYATGIAFLPRDPRDAASVEATIASLAADEGLEILGWRDLPVDNSMIGSAAKAAEPTFRQVFIACCDTGGTRLAGLHLDRLAYMLRKRSEHEISLNQSDDAAVGMGGAGAGHDGVYFASLSSRTIVYKGMLTTDQLAAFFPDLTDPRMKSAMALVHSRFSTNTFPSWPLAHPYRLVAHNGEINTVQGNRNWMRAREALLETDLLPGDLERIFPICTPGASDTAGFDEALELLYLGGYPLPEAVMMMIPEPWENHREMDPDRLAFYEYHSSLIEPWDGPASIAFTDGSVIGAVLDRNGLRPSRYWVTDDDLVVMASEVGVVDIASSKVIEKGRLEPGRMFLIDTLQGRIIRDDEIKANLASARPYRQWLDDNLVHLADLPAGNAAPGPDGRVVRRQQAFGYTLEELKLLVAPMARDAKEAIGSMGSDTPVAALSGRARLVYDYFQQLFAQVTNPPLDAMREELITSVAGNIGAEANLLRPTAESCRQIRLPHPVLTEAELASIIRLDGAADPSNFKTTVLDACYPVEDGGSGLTRALERLAVEASEAIRSGSNVIVISDRGADVDMAPVPSLLATGAVHHHLIAEKTRTLVGLVVESGDAREVHHVALLLGFGAGGVCPYVAFESIDLMLTTGAHGLPATLTPEAARQNFIRACDKGILKVMSKMGISTVASYTGAQIFEAIGLGGEVVDRCFRGVVSRLGGVGFDVLADEVAHRHAAAFPERPEERAHRTLEVGGEYQWRREGEHHLFNPETVFRLQHATRTGRYDIFREYTRMVDDQARNLATLRGLFRFRDNLRPAIDIEEVEPVSEIVRRFATGAMSYGSISAEAHETLAIAMNRLGGKSNTGEGGEDPSRYLPERNGDLRRSAIKQVASGRFGVTSEYLVNSDDLQIKMAQGAKPGEGGQLPGHKVYPWIARTRHSTPGVALISPPPHHDIYSIEDLAQLVHDLKNSNPSSRVHVKLVAEVGVGTVAAGVSKAHADVVLISGHDGGTGASPLTSIKHAGAPWELGLAETQQTLLMNNLRDRIVVQVDGQLKTGRDVVIAALLGADEFGFATAPLVVSGCVMMRVCHLDTCPVGVATQNPELRKKFSGKPEFVVTFFEFLAEEVREILASLGFRSIQEAIGQVEVLDTVDAIDHWKASHLDLKPILHMPDLPEAADRCNTGGQDHGLDAALDNDLIRMAAASLESGSPTTITCPVRNVNRAVGTMLGYELTRRYGGSGLPDDTIRVNLEGSAGNSLGAFVPKGITLRLSGDANDYVGKGLSGGRIIISPPGDSPFLAEEQVIAGNVILYGATSGEAFIRGRVGERFCVRNSGALAVVEGVGDHGCEYMTGGRAVVLGGIGRNFAAGMSGGVAFVYDPTGMARTRVNPEMVILEDPDDEDRDWLRVVVERHHVETSSGLAEALLGDWSTTANSFFRVMPVDYKRVLEAAAAARAAGGDEVEAIMASTRD
ncbi:MAG: glutamate synthase large subunit [Actinobacteria bacterium]|jgi:glutamate synthase (NADPH/NADH) large chain|nr:glutamate synthase large subunit [Actinomycetota bacterium]MBT3687713.1 glutamate synthase large subunit [Actinomycetota bacterium]MBT4036975.1 glutamate synthase large subunit [Actinomycetota bacterium]MBT4279224.1 glutamate synthase large subunit [Actinomycetota bacterium]MBT4344122.1 glutamate synthase large subunit [Actinomycetota bacterium]